MNTPPEGEDLMEHLLRKYGRIALERYGKPGNALDMAGKQVGVKFNPARRVVQTMGCHQLMAYCNEILPEAANLLMDTLFRKYFEEALDVSNVDVLVAAAIECGLPLEGASNVVRGGRYKAEILNDIHSSQRTQGISGVPHVMIQGLKVGSKPISFSGALPSAVIAEQLVLAAHIVEV